MWPVYFSRVEKVTVPRKADLILICSRFAKIGFRMALLKQRKLKQIQDSRNNITICFSYKLNHMQYFEIEKRTKCNILFPKTCTNSVV